MVRCFSCFQEFEEGYDICPHCGFCNAMAEGEAYFLQPGTTLAGRYILGHSIGAGGFGIVYRAWDEKLETVVAIKEFYPSRLVNRAPGTRELILLSGKGRKEFNYRKARFLSEARHMAKFGAHRSIVNVFEYFEENNTAYIVMELLEGIALNSYLKQNGGKLDPETAVTVANEVCKALSALHAAGIVHCDVAPDNIFICPRGVIKLLDLGAAKLTDDSEKAIDIVLKPGFSPPEQYDNSNNIGPWTDIYALGATLYLLLTGIKPDESTNRKIQDEVEPVHLVEPAVPENLSNTVMRAMALEKHLRFRSVDEFQKALNGEKKVLSVKKEKKRRKNRKLTGILAAVLALAVGAGALFSVYSRQQAAQTLEPAEIEMWYAVGEDSTESAAVTDILSDFESKFEGVTVKTKAIPEAEYADAIAQAARDGELPELFESTGLDDTVLRSARDVSAVLETEQAAACLFLDQYESYYTSRKRLPLAFEVPMAFVITSGPVCIPYEQDTFASLSDFGTDAVFAFETACMELVDVNFGEELHGRPADESTFYNNEANESSVLLSSSLYINHAREVLTNYGKTMIPYAGETVTCHFTYEWSLGGGDEDQQRAAERLLSWMLGNPYQTSLMITNCSDGQLPLNKTSFNEKCTAKYLQKLPELANRFVFSGNKEE